MYTEKKSIRRCILQHAHFVTSLFFRPLFLLLFLRSPIEFARAHAHRHTIVSNLLHSISFACARPQFIHIAYLLCTIIWYCAFCVQMQRHNSKSRKSIASIAYMLYGRLVKWQWYWLLYGDGNNIRRCQWIAIH